MAKKPKMKQEAPATEPLEELEPMIPPNKKRHWFDKRPVLKLPNKDRTLLKKEPNRTFLITMFYPNSTAATFTIKTKRPEFTHQGGKYLINEDDARLDTTLQRFHLYYHANHPTPIQREVYLTGNKEFFSIRPDSMEAYIDYRQLQGVMTGGEDDNKMLLLIVLCAINIVMSLIVVLKVTGTLK